MKIVELKREGNYFTGEAQTAEQTYWFMTDGSGNLMKVDQEFESHSSSVRGWLTLRPGSRRPRGLQRAIVQAIKARSVTSRLRPGSVAAKKLRQTSKH
jgi:hypothetical protein